MPARQGTLTTRLRVILVGVILLTVVVVVAVLPAAFSIRDANDALQQRWLPASDSARVLLSSLVDQETGERGYIITLDPSYLDPYRSGRTRTVREFAVLRARTPAALHPGIDRLRSEYRRWRAQSEREIRAVAANDAAAARVLVASGQGRTYFGAMRRTHAALQDRIDRETARAEHDVTSANRTLFVAIGIGALGAVVFALLARRLLRRWAANVDAQQQALVELGEQTRLVEGLTRQTPDPIFLKDADGRFRFVNDGAARVMGRGRVEGFVGRTDAEIFPPDELEALRRDDDLVRRDGVTRDFEEAVGGRRFLVTKSPYAFHDGSIGILGVGRDITDRVRSEARIASLAVLGQAVGRESTVLEVARAAVEPLAHATAAATVWIFRADVVRRRLEPIIDFGTHRRLRDEWQSVPIDGDTNTAQTFRTGAIRIVTRDDVGSGAPVAGVLDSEALATIAHVPLTAAGSTIGVVAFGWRAGTSVADDEEEAFLRGLATVLAEALARAAATELERAAVVTFQRALLPNDRFSPLLEVATRYEPALDGVALGGDWYDVFDVGPDRLGIAVGDVVGNGIAAAAVMGRLRSALHAIAEVLEDPGAVLTHLDRYASEVHGASGTTAFFAVYDRVGSTLTYSCAGHPPPALRHGDSIRTLDDARGIPLGTGLAVTARPTATVALVPGDLLVVFSDGLVERRGESIDRGIGRLTDAAVAVGDLPIEDTADALLARSDPAGRRDDTVIVCARVPAADARHRTFRVPAEPRRLASLRRELCEWLRGHDVDDAIVDDVLVGVTEAVSNAIEHAYAHDETQTVVVEGTVDGDLRLTVRDGGRWTPPVRRPERGRGLLLLRSLMDTVDVSPSPQGTTVRMTRSLG